MTPRVSGALAALALLVAGCGDGSEPADPGPQPGPTTSSAELTSDAPSSVPTDEPTDEPTYEPADEATGSRLRQLTSTASDAVVAMFARSDQTYDADVAAALPYLTDAFGEEFKKTTDEVRDAFVGGVTKVTVEVSATGVTGTTSAGAEAMVFRTQTTGRAGEQGRAVAYTILVELVREGEKYLVNGVEIGGTSEARIDNPAAAAVADAARALATEFTNLDYRTIKDDRRAVLALATGAFAREFEDSADSLAELTTQSRSTMTSEVGGVGIVELGETSAQALVATSGTVTNTASAGEQQRDFRILLTLTRVGATWLVSGLELV